MLTAPPMYTCRVCHEFIVDSEPMLTFASRHHAHWGCYVARWGEKIFEKLKAHQLLRCPYRVIRDNNLMEKFDEYFGKTSATKL